MQNAIQQCLYFAGLAQITLAMGSLAIPPVLNWRTELAKVQPLIKQMFWTYAGYIFVINLSFGLLSLFYFKQLTNGTTLAMLVTGFIALYWVSRILVQFLYFNRANFPAGRWNVLAEIILVTLFIGLSVVYSFTFYFNYQHN
jgi:hypothetical protein